jgi:hypothetical protein
MNSLFTITCGGCGQAFELESWCRTALGGELPRAQYQCPGCKRAFRVEKTPVVIYAGKVFNQPNKIIPVQARL